MSQRESVDPRMLGNATDKSLKISPNLKENDEILSVSPPIRKP